MKIALIPVLLILLLIGGCLGDDDDNPVASQGDSIVGSWLAESMTFHWGALANPDSSESINYAELDVVETVTFNSDGTFSVLTIEGDEEESDSGSWTISGTTLTISGMEDGEEETEAFQVVITSDLMTLTQQAEASGDAGTPEEGEPDWIVIVFARQ